MPKPVITILLAEIVRIGFGTKAFGWENLVYGVLLVAFIIFLSKGILGSLTEKLEMRGKPGHLMTMMRDLGWIEAIV